MVLCALHEKLQTGTGEGEAEVAQETSPVTVVSDTQHVSDRDKDNHRHEPSGP